MPAPLGHSLLSWFWIAQLLDLALITLIIWLVVRQLWRTPAMTVIAVLAVILLLGIMLRRLQLHTVGFLAEELTGVLFIATVIIFHAEIKAMLGSLGRYAGRVLGGGVWTGHGTVESIVSACLQMKEKGIGGLIVLERSENLDTLYGDGVELDRLEVNPDLVTSMFTPPGPLHDGAVVIRDDRIVRASAVLPLSRRTYFRPRLGTRHRAALGITERSDAIAVAVSEETGSFRVAHDGRMEGPLSVDRMRELLLELTGHKKE